MTHNYNEQSTASNNKCYQNKCKIKMQKIIINKSRKCGKIRCKRHFT